MSDCERTSLYFDGELSPAEEPAVLDHLAGCARCQEELGDWIGIATAVSRSRAAPGVAGVRARHRMRWWVGGGLAVAAAAALAVLMLGPRPPGPQTIALADARSFEARLTAPAFDRHRPYRVERGALAHEVLPLDALADLERRGDLAGLAAAHLLAGDLARAGQALDALPASPARDSDRAALALAAADPRTALLLANEALAKDPALSPALWNRALALRALELPLAAAAALDTVAARGEAGWSDEAKKLAAALRAPMVIRARAPDPGPVRDDVAPPIDAARRAATERRTGGDLPAAEQALLATASVCRAPIAAVPCGNVDRDLAELYLQMGRLDDADARLRAARLRFASSGALAQEDALLSLVAQLERQRGRDRVAAAYLEELALRQASRKR